jgi:hypothetical protein
MLTIVGGVVVLALLTAIYLAFTGGKRDPKLPPGKL